MTHDKKTSRRAFLSGAAGVCAFDIIPGSVFAQPAPTDRINFGGSAAAAAGSCALNPTANQSEPSAEPATARCVPRGRPQVRMGPCGTSVSSNNDVSPASEKFLADI